MLHRHLNHQNYTLAAVDDVIARGRQKDWADLRRAALSNKTLGSKILRVCRAHIDDPYAQRYHLWSLYAERKLA
jgi:hypothetical protein